MIIFPNSRQSGKSTEAIKIAAATHSLLIVPTRDCVKLTEQIAREINYPVIVTSATEYFKERYGYGRSHGRVERIVIDELEWCLHEIFGCEVTMATTTGFVNEFEIAPPIKIEYKGKGFD